MSTPPTYPDQMDPAGDPEELIAACIYWHPLIFPTRTEVLDHLFLVNGNGYEWNAAGQLCSVFAHIEPGPDGLDKYEAEALEFEAKAADARVPELRDLWLEWAADRRTERDRLLAIRADYRNLARTYGPVRDTEQLPGTCDRGARTISSGYLARWTLLGRAPEHVDPRWQRLADEVRLLFADILAEQGQLF